MFFWVLYFESRNLIHPAEFDYALLYAGSKHKETVSFVSNNELKFAGQPQRLFSPTKDHVIEPIKAPANVTKGSFRGNSIGNCQTVAPESAGIQKKSGLLIALLTCDLRSSPQNGRGPRFKLTGAYLFESQSTAVHIWPFEPYRVCQNTGYG